MLLNQIKSKLNQIEWVELLKLKLNSYLRKCYWIEIKSNHIGWSIQIQITIKCLT